MTKMKIKTPRLNTVHFILGSVHISAIWGIGSYTENHGSVKDTLKLIRGGEGVLDSSTVEVMVTGTDEQFRKKLNSKYKEYFDGMSLFTYLPVADFIDLIAYCKKYEQTKQSKAGQKEQSTPRASV